MMLESHLTCAHTLWQTVIKPGDTVVDATLGNGHDALFLAQALQGKGTLIGYDLQEQALQNSYKKLESITGITLQLHQKCHSFLEAIDPKLIVYNLGYLPGSDKAIRTEITTTLASIRRAQELLITEGVISITLYPGHLEGLEEKESLLQYAKNLNKEEWLVTWVSWPNRLTGPSLLFLQKKKRPLPS